MTYDLKDWLNSVNFSKENLLKEDPTQIKEYPPFIVNKCLSGQIDCIFFANEMNINHHLDKDMQYEFFINTLRKKKRFSPWLKKQKVDDLTYVKKYYGYSNEKALQALKILSKQQIAFIRNRLEIGGTK
jgi:hypothetical protein